MKIVNIIGGIGNQMFQYAFALSLIEKFPNEEIKIDTSHFNGYGLHNGFEIERVFGLSLPVATKEDLKKLTFYSPNYKISRLYRKLFGYKKTEFKEPSLFTYWGAETYEIKNDCYYEGSWQNEQYFKDINENIRKAFSFKIEFDSHNSSLLNKIISSNSVAIHVRRGDYLLEDAYKNICDLPYYRNAINYIKNNIENPVFYIFSNDAEWCRENILPICGSADVIDWNGGSDSWKDMKLMSLCKHNIIAHSSFSWWSAWLNNNVNKIVISPQKWFNKKGVTEFPQLKEWILLANE